jgi:hypothetical protein
LPARQCRVTLVLPSTIDQSGTESVHPTVTLPVKTIRQPNGLCEEVRPVNPKRHQHRKAITVTLSYPILVPNRHRNGNRTSAMTDD